MATRNFNFSVGPDPSKQDSEGNGKWEARAPDAEAALRAVLASVTFPGELTGRYEGVFVEGVSLPGRRAEEVIQVWIDDPEAGRQTGEFGSQWSKEIPPHSHLFAFPAKENPWTCRHGLVKEIAVEEIAKYLIPLRPLPAGLALPAPGDQTALSPIGQLACAGISLEHRLGLYLSAQEARLRQVRSQLEIEASAKTLRDRTWAMNRQLAVLNTYMHGLTAAEIVQSGERAPAAEPYHIFQSRLYLDQEIGLLVNLRELDFRDVAKLDEWLVESGHWRKLLPHPKTILVTRIRARAQAYAGVNSLQEMIWNYWNMQNLVWVRDGDFVFRFATDLHFDDAIFKASNETERLERQLAAAVFASKFRRNDSPSEKPGLSAKAVSEEEPFVRPEQRDGYDSLEAWMRSEDYLPETEKAIQEAARTYVEGSNIKRLPFLVLLQGMVDSSTVLNIPPGTNLLDPLSVGRYFRLVYDQDGAITDSSARTAYDRQVAPLNQKKGDWVLARVGRSSDVNATFYQVASTSADGITVRYTPTARRWPHKRLSSTRTRKITRFLPVNLSSELVARLLDDRDWKIHHPSLVPVLARWAKVQRYVRGNPENEGQLALGKGLDCFDAKEAGDE